LKAEFLLLALRYIFPEVVKRDLSSFIKGQYQVIRALCTAGFHEIDGTSLENVL
jgi:hypothetical protein